MREAGHDVKAQLKDKHKLMKCALDFMQEYDKNSSNFLDLE